MAWRFRKSRSLGQHGKVNLTKKGVGFSFGIPGLRLSLGPDGRIRRTIGIPGTGLYCIDIIGRLFNRRR